MSELDKASVELARPISIDGKTYNLNSMSEAAKAQLVNIQATDAELKRLAVQTAIAQTARAVYGKALKDELEKDTPLPNN
jgi:adenosine/AMP kinase